MWGTAAAACVSVGGCLAGGSVYTPDTLGASESRPEPPKAILSEPEGSDIESEHPTCVCVSKSTSVSSDEFDIKEACYGTRRF